MYERGKCAYKLLQYGASGVPIVGSPVGANVSALERLGGFSASTPSDWVDALSACLTAPAVDRKNRGEQGVAGVQMHYSYEAWSAEWRRAVGLT
jgi:glycosyltransferase involved in cell wall biosynthesis